MSSQRRRTRPTLPFLLGRGSYRERSPDVLTKESARPRTQPDAPASGSLNSTDRALGTMVGLGAGAVPPVVEAIHDTSSTRPSFLSEAEWAIVPEVLRGSPALLAVIFHRDPSQAMAEAVSSHHGAFSS